MCAMPAQRSPDEAPPAAPDRTSGNDCAQGQCAMEVCTYSTPEIRRYTVGVEQHVWITVNRTWSVRGSFSAS
jgi:hypothetical protein